MSSTTKTVRFCSQDGSGRCSKCFFYKVPGVLSTQVSGFIRPRIAFFLRPPKVPTFFGAPRLYVTYRPEKSASTVSDDHIEGYGHSGAVFVMGHVEHRPATRG